MPKNKGKGGKNYRKGKHSVPSKKDLVTKDADQGLEYARVEKMLGNGRVIVKCFDEVTRVGHIRGKMRRKVWIIAGDLVLCSLREFQNKKCDVILKYLPDEVKQLKALGQIPEHMAESQSNPSSDIIFADGTADNDLDNLSQSDDSDSDDDNSDDDSDGDMKFKKKIEEKKAEINIDDI